MQLIARLDFTSFLENYNRTYPFRLAYEDVLEVVERADEEAKKVPRAPRTYDESDKKLKNEKIVTKKTAATADENKNKKKPKVKTMATKNVQEEEEEEEEIEEESVEETETKVVEEEADDSPMEDRVPLVRGEQNEFSLRHRLGSFFVSSLAKHQQKLRKGNQRKFSRLPARTRTTRTDSITRRKPARQRRKRTKLALRSPLDPNRAI